MSEDSLVCVWFRRLAKSEIVSDSLSQRERVGERLAKRESFRSI